jgi:hypothetical protein
VLRVALADDAALDDETRRAADGDADPDATFLDFRRQVDMLLEQALKAESDRLAKAAASPQDLQRLRQLNDHLKEVKARLAAPLARDDSEV